MSVTGPIRIAFCITDLDPGGAERALVQLVTRLDRSAWEPAVFCLSKPGSLVSDLEQAKIPVTCYGASRSWHAGRVFLSLRKNLREWQPRLLQTFLFHANFLGRLAGRSAGVPCIVSGLRVAERRSRGHLVLDRWTNSLVAANVCVSRSVAEFSVKAGGLLPSKVPVIHNGVDAEKFAVAAPVSLASLGIPPGARVILTVGRLDPQKGLLVLLDSAKSLVAEFPELHFLLVGEGPQRSELETGIRHRGLSGRVHLAGWRADVPQLLKAATIFVLPSLWEGLPNVVLEAMAAGVPVICSRVEGAEELIDANRTGLLVDPGSPTELQPSIRQLLREPERADQLARAARETVRLEFTWEQMAARYQTLYRQLLSADATDSRDSASR